MIGQLLAVCPSLEQLPASSIDDLISIWSGVRVRIFMHYQLSARAYFIFLKLSGSQAGSSPGLDDMNVTASLRLLRLLVKYAGELKTELESGFSTTPTKPWKGKSAGQGQVCSVDASTKLVERSVIQSEYACMLTKTGTVVRTVS